MSIKKIILGTLVGLFLKGVEAASVGDPEECTRSALFEDIIREVAEDSMCSLDADLLYEETYGQGKLHDFLKGAVDYERELFDNIVDPINDVVHQLWGPSDGLQSLGQVKDVMVYIANKFREQEGKLACLHIAAPPQNNKIKTSVSISPFVCLGNQSKLSFFCFALYTLNSQGIFGDRVFNQLGKHAFGESGACYINIVKPINDALIAGKFNKDLRVGGCFSDVKIAISAIQEKLTQNQVLIERHSRVAQQRLGLARVTNKTFGHFDTLQALDSATKAGALVTLCNMAVLVKDLVSS
ncbi:MAG: hypothetical protein NTX76_06275 [Alphaproteobacteria bacterium]|nr:hypothetical protein [Alphaproteobacteria bacterium]